MGLTSTRFELCSLQSIPFEFHFGVFVCTKTAYKLSLMSASPIKNEIYLPSETVSTVAELSTSRRTTIPAKINKDTSFYTFYPECTS